LKILSIYVEDAKHTESRGSKGVRSCHHPYLLLFLQVSKPVMGALDKAISKEKR
jgi:hypothetical protein